MKNVFCATALLLGLSVMFISCEKSGTENRKDEEYPIVGCWISDFYESESHKYDRESDKNKIKEYIEFTDAGIEKWYYVTNNYATYKDGVLSYSGEWELCETDVYWIKNGVFWDETLGSCEFEMINKDKFSLSWYTNSGNMATEYFVRIKKFSK